MAKHLTFSLWTDARSIRCLLAKDGWLTPDTYTSNMFAPLSKGAAVYLFLSYQKSDFDNALVSYVGQSTNLCQRLAAHEILRDLDQNNFWTMRWFRRTRHSLLRDVEREYIRRFNPPWNIIGRQRGIQA